MSEYFASVDHAVLKELLRRKIRDQKLLRLLDSLVETGEEGGSKGMPISCYSCQRRSGYRSQSRMLLCSIVTQLRLVIPVIGSRLPRLRLRRQWLSPARSARQFALSFRKQRWRNWSNTVSS